MATLENTGDFIFYSGSDGKIKAQVIVGDDTVWTSQKGMAELFSVEVNTINYHLKEIYQSAELLESATIRKIRIVQEEGNRHDKGLCHG